jgi:hypothetical protein
MMSRRKNPCQDAVPFGYKTDPDNLLSFTVFRGSLNYILKLFPDDINCILNIHELRPEHLLRLYGYHSSYTRDPGVKSLKFSGYYMYHII